MDTLRALTGWVLFVIMAILAGFFWHQSDTRGKRIEELTVRISEIDAQINRLTTDVISLREQLTEAETLFENPDLPVRPSTVTEPSGMPSVPDPPNP